MDRNGLLLPVIVLFFFFFLVADCSTATTQVADSGGKVTNPIPVDPAKDNPRKSSLVNQESVEGSISKDDNHNDDNNTAAVTVTSSTVFKQQKVEKSQQGIHNKLDDQTKSQLETNAICDGLPKSCRDHKALVTCFQIDSKDLVLKVQNKGESNLKVKIVANDTMEHEIPQNQSQRINKISFPAGQDIKIVLNSGDGDCVLHMQHPSVSEGNFFKRLAAFYKPVIPIYTEYFLFIMVLIAGGTLGFFKFRKRRRVESGVAYQELEMGLPEASASAVGASDTAEGWDQGWDDDWDEENAVKSPGGGRHVGNFSANGLTSRSSNRDGWEDNWDY